MDDPLLVPAPEFPAELAQRLAAERFGLSGELTPLASERDRNFRLRTEDGRSFLVKVQNPADPPSVVEFQTLAVRHVERVDPSLPVMRVVTTRDGQPWVEAEGRDGRRSLVRVFTFLEGHNPATEELDEGALFAWGATVARLGRALRGFFHPAAGYPIQWDISRAPRLRPLLGHVADADQRALVEEVLDRFDARVAPHLPALRAQVIHNDMSLDNVLVDHAGRVTGITDFGDMTHAPLVCDLAVTLSDVLDGRPDSFEMAGPVIAGYRSVTPLEDGEADLLGDLMAARAATAVVVSAWRLELYPENAAYVSTFGTGAWRYLRLAGEEGFGEVAGRLSGPGRGLPARRGSGDLLARRRGSMGLAPLSYRDPVHLVRGEGVWLFDAEGRRYLDAYNNVPVVGHGHPRVVAAVAAQLRLLNTNTRYLHESAVELSERLLASMPAACGFDRVLLVNSGSEANDVAWRIATWATGRRGALISSFAYHGITEATMAFSREEWPADYRPPHVGLVPAPDGSMAWSAEVARAAADLAANGIPVAAAIADAAFTSDGIRWPPPEDLRGALQAVHEAGGLWVADEVQAGFGRDGTNLWAFATAGLAPDVVTMGKPMGNGYPVAAVVTRSDLVDDFARRTGFFSTFGGNPPACAAALAVLDVIRDEELVANAGRMGARLLEGLHGLRARHGTIRAVRGRGLLVGVQMATAGQATTVVEALRHAGVLIGTTGPDEDVLKIRPPLPIRESQVDLLLGCLDEALGDLGRG